ncbi:MAG: two-component system, OmpR family, sensor histidine kinase VicK [Patescibacteria group bacterium]|nr:two-component system, OmpR family, sensor histidine kinase VicK [Patescibacteria group bacterium]
MTSKESVVSKQESSWSDLPNVDYEPRFHIKVVSRTKISKDVIALSLERPKDFIFTPGQYIWFILPELTKYFGVIDRKAYSIVSSIDNKHIDIVVKLTNSDFTKKMRLLKVGDDVDIVGPMGSAFIVPEDGCIMISESIGLASFLSILRSNTSVDCRLFAYDIKGGALTYFSDEIEMLSKKYNYKTYLSYESPQVSDFDCIINKKCNKQIYIIGSQDFVNATTSMLANNKVSPSRLHYEGIYPQTEQGKKLEKQFSDYFNNKSQDVVSNIGDIFLQATQQITNHIILTDDNGRILFANQAVTDITGYTFNEIKGKTPRIWGGLSSGDSYKSLWKHLKSGKSAKRVIVNRRRDGQIYTVVATITPILNQGLFVATEENISTLREVDKAKTEFVSIASHQLRTPLSVIKWYVEMLLSGDVGVVSEKQAQYLHEVYASSEHMVELVNSLLDVSRLELGTLKLVRESVNVIDIVNDVIKEQMINIEKKKIKLSFNSDKNVPALHADPKLVRMVIQNLLSNAIKYTPDNGKVHIGYSFHGKDDILFKISDNGYGIPKSQQSRIFTKFFRADNIRSKITEGTGLGLYIIKLIIDNYGGKVWFESKENKGTTFYMLIPIGIATNKEREMGIRI